MQPLPFFTSIHQAASFLGRSKRAVEAQDQPPIKPRKLNSNQDMFLFRPSCVDMPANPAKVQFEVERAAEAAGRGKVSM
jgi:hypothetical protein